jgi:sulfur carrier protein ThiS
LIEVRLFGDLWRDVDGLTFAGAAIYLPAESDSTLGQVLDQVGINPDEVSNVFVNGRLLPRSTYPITLGYPLAAPVPLSPEGCWNTPVHSGDRLGIFPRNMGSVVV